MPKIITNKEYLIQKSLEVFQKNGYYHTSFSELARACKIEKSHFYYYFKDKKDLMKEVLVYSSEYIQKHVFSIAENEEITSKEKLSRMLVLFQQIYTQSPSGCFMGNTLLETVGREEHFKGVLLHYFDEFRRALRIIYQEKYPKEEAGFRAMGVLSNIQGSIMLSRLYKDDSILKDTFRQLIDDF